jgi:hypothetical protein
LFDRAVLSARARALEVALRAADLAELAALGDVRAAEQLEALAALAERK